jgi:putative ABC transport system permease protein
VVAFASAALLLAALGIYGVVAYGVALRRRELGIRIALGARAAQVTRLVIWQGLRPVAYGLLCGIAVALTAGRLIRTLLFGVSATDGWTLGAITLILASISLLACLLPSRAALRIEPAGVLRQD